MAPRLDTYGGDRVIGRYARGLQARGHEVRVVSVGDPVSTNFYRGLDTLSLGLDAFPRSKLDYVRACSRALRRVSDPGVVIATWTPTVPLAVALRKLRGASRTVWLAQDYTEMFENLPTETWLLRHGAGLCDAVVSISTLCSTHLGADRYPGKVTLIHSGLDDVFFQAGGGADRAGILFVGDPIERKGWRDFVQAWRGLRSTRPDLGFTLLCRTPPEGGVPEGGRCLVGLSDEEVAEQYRSAQPRGRVGLARPRGDGGGDSRGHDPARRLRGIRTRWRELPDGRRRGCARPGAGGMPHPERARLEARAGGRGAVDRGEVHVGSRDRPIRGRVRWMSHGT